MALDPQLKSQLAQTVWIADETGRGVDGKPAYGARRSLPARVVGRIQQVRNTTGEEVQSMRQLILEEKISRNSKLWLPDEDPDTDRGHRPVAVAERFGEKGELDHVKVWL